MIILIDILEKYKIFKYCFFVFYYTLKINRIGFEVESQAFLVNECLKQQIGFFCAKTK